MRGEEVEGKDARYCFFQSLALEDSVKEKRFSVFFLKSGD